MPQVNRNTPVAARERSTIDQTRTGRATHEVDVGAVVNLNTRGGGDVSAEIGPTTATASTACADPADILARIQNGGARETQSSDVAAYTVNARVDVPLTVRMRADAEAFAEINGDVLRNEGSSAAEHCADTPPADQDRPNPIPQGDAATQGPQRPTPTRK